MPRVMAIPPLIYGQQTCVDPDLVAQPSTALVLASSTCCYDLICLLMLIQSLLDSQISAHSLQPAKRLGRARWHRYRAGANARSHATTETPTASDIRISKIRAQTGTGSDIDRLGNIQPPSDVCQVPYIGQPTPSPLPAPTSYPLGHPVRRRTVGAPYPRVSFFIIVPSPLNE